MKSCVLVPALLLCVIVRIPAAADTIIYSNLGPDGSYSHDSVALVDEYRTTAVSFVGTGAWLTEIDIPYLFSRNDRHLPEGRILFSLVTDSGGKPEGAGRESFYNAELSLDGGMLTLVSSSHPGLASGVTYWLVASEPSWEFFGWALNTTGSTGVTTCDPYVTYPCVWNHSSGATPAFRVLGRVPEPSSLLLLGSGLVGLVSVARRKLGK